MQIAWKQVLAGTVMAVVLGAAPLAAQTATSPWSADVGLGFDNSISGNINSSGVGRINNQAVVVLKNSYENGAWRWDYQKRCLYANFMDNDFHLLAVLNKDNRKKGDKGPDKFMPSNPSFACEYLSIWLKIKLLKHKQGSKNI